MFFLNNCKSPKKVEIITDTIIFTFVKDTMGYERYWLKEKNLGGFHFEDVMTLVVDLDLICDDTVVKVPEQRKTFYDLPQYQDQTKRDSSFYTHHGGQVFKNTKEEIVIIFDIKANVLKLEEKPCEGFYIQNSYSCPIERQTIEYPIYLVIDIIEAYNIDNSILENEKLYSYDRTSFAIGVCD